MTYTEPREGQHPTHTIEIFRGPAPRAEGDDLAIVIGDGATLAQAVWAWLEGQGLSLDNPDTYALLVPVGDGQDNPAAAVLPVVAVEEEFSTAEVAQLLYGPLLERPDETASEVAIRRRRRLSDAAKEARRMGISPVPDRRSGQGQRLWPKGEVVTALAARPGKGNRTPRGAK